MCFRDLKMSSKLRVTMHRIKEVKKRKHPAFLYSRYNIHCSFETRKMMMMMMIRSEEGEKETKKRAYFSLCVPSRPKKECKQEHSRWG